MLNTISIIGRLTAEPELRYTKNGTAVCAFTVACDRDVKGEDGSRKTDFIDCVAWRSTGEFVSKYFNKGSLLCVTGRLEIRDWTDKNGNKRRNAEIVVSSAYFCESKPKDADNEAPEPPETYNGDFQELESDGELPF